MKDITNKIVTNNLRTTILQHELPEADLTQGRDTPDKSFIFKSVSLYTYIYLFKFYFFRFLIVITVKSSLILLQISRLLDRLSHRLENPGLDIEIHNLHNTTISVLLYYLDMLDRDDLGKAYNRISGTSYKEETIRYLY